MSKLASSSLVALALAVAIPHLAVAGGATAAAPISSVSIAVRSACSAEVKIAYGNTIASLAPGEVDYRSLEVGARVAVLDPGEHVLDWVEIGSSTSEVRVGSDCRSIGAR